MFEKNIWRENVFVCGRKGEGLIERSGAGYEGDTSVASGSAC